MLRLHAEPGVPALLVRLREEPEVIGLEPLGATQVARFEPRDSTAHLAKQELLGVPGEAGAGRVEGHARTGPLVKVHRILLCEGDGLSGPGHAAQVERTRDLIVTPQETVSEIEGADVGAPAQYILSLLVEAPVHRRQHEADPTLAVAEVLLGPHHGVVGGGLHRFAERARGALRNGIEDTDGLSARQPARQLPGPIDRGGRRRARLAVVELGRATDAPRVEQSLAVAVHLAAIHAEAENPRALHEKRPPFLKERI